MAESNTGGSSSLSPSELFASIANALRSKKGTTAAIPAKDFPEAIQGSGVQPVFNVSGRGNS